MKVSNVKSKTVMPLFPFMPETTEVESGEKVFRAQYDNLLEQESVEYIEGKMREITELGNKLCEKADMAQLNRYKALIRDLMNYTVSNGYRFSKSGGFDSRGRGKIYGLIKKVNEKLDELTNAFLHEESDNIDIVASVNDIRGLLVDMLL